MQAVAQDWDALGEYVRRIPSGISSSSAGCDNMELGTIMQTIDDLIMEKKRNYMDRLDAAHTNLSNVKLENDSFRQQLEQKQRENSDLSNRLSNMTSKLQIREADMESRLAEMQQQYPRLLKDHERHKQDYIAKLATTQDEYEHRLDEKDAEMQRLKQKLLTMEETHSDLDDNKRLLAEQNSQLQEDVHQLRQKLSAATAREHDAIDRFNQLREDMENTEAKVSDVTHQYEAKLEQIQTTMKKQGRRVTSLQTEVEEARRQAAAHLATIRDLELELEVARDSRHKLDQDLSDRDREIESRGGKLTRLAADHAQCASRISRLQRDLDDIRENAKRQGDFLSSVEAEALRERLRLAEHSEDQQRKVSGELRRQLSTVEQEFNTSRENTSVSANAAVGQLRAEVSQLEAALRAAESATRTVEKEAQNADEAKSEELRAAQKKTASLQAELDKLTTQLNDSSLSRNLQQHRAEGERLRTADRVEKLEMDLVTKNKQINALNDELEQASSRQFEEEKIATLSSNRDILASQLQQSQAELNEAKNELQSTQRLHQIQLEDVKRKSYTEKNIKDASLRESVSRLEAEKALHQTEMQKMKEDKCRLKKKLKEQHALVVNLMDLSDSVDKHLGSLEAVSSRTAIGSGDRHRSPLGRSVDSLSLRHTPPGRFSTSPTQHLPDYPSYKQPPQPTVHRHNHNPVPIGHNPIPISANNSGQSRHLPLSSDLETVLSSHVTRFQDATHRLLTEM